MALANPYARELKKRLVGRTIVKSEARPFPDDRGNTVYNPRLTLDDGTTVSGSENIQAILKAWSTCGTSSRIT